MSVIEKTSVIVLAAGKGTRLNEGEPSELPKVMHEINGRPMLSYTLNLLKEAGFKDIVIVVGYKAEVIKKHFGDTFTYVIQEEQYGTGHAVQCAQGAVDPKAEHIFVLQGDDSAFYRPETIQHFISGHAASGATASVLTLDHPYPGELGRVIRNEYDHIIAIKEKEVLTDQERTIREINTGTYCFQARWLWEHITRLRPSATGKGELIIPDLIAMAVEESRKVAPHKITNPEEWIGINTPEQLEYASQVMAKRMSS